MTPLEAAAMVILKRRWPTANVPQWVRDGVMAEARDVLAPATLLIADDAFAATFQTMGQYRSALLRALVGETSVSGNEE